MLWHNVTVLLEPWLQAKVEQYSRLPAAEKTAYLDRFLDRTELWNEIGSACLKDGAKPGNKGGPSASKMVMEQIEQSARRAAPAQQRQITAFMAAVQARWLWRQLPSFSL